jgi:hypothetical protein
VDREAHSRESSSESGKHQFPRPGRVRTSWFFLLAPDFALVGEGVIYGEAVVLVAGDMLADNSPRRVFVRAMRGIGRRSCGFAAKWHSAEAGTRRMPEPWLEVLGAKSDLTRSVPS